MNAMSARDEVTTVKRALRAAGFDVSSVTRGRGTAYGWLRLTFSVALPAHDHATRSEGPFAECRPTCPAFLVSRSEVRRAIVVAQGVTGRRGEYDGEINTTVTYTFAIAESMAA